MTQNVSGWAEQVIKGGEQKILQPRIVLYAPAGVGKSTFGSTLSKPIFLDFDRGIDDLNVDRIPGPKNWSGALAIVRAIAADPRDYKSLVIDTVDPLEEMAIDHVLQIGGKKSLNDFDYGAGYNAVSSEWKLLLAELDTARKNGMLVCLLGHAIVRQAQDPQLGSFDQFTSQLGKKSWALTTRWADLVGFAAFESALAQKKGDDARVIVTSERFLFTVRGSGFEAKNRFSMAPKLPLSWPAVEAAIARHRQSSAEVKAKILKIATGTKHEAKALAFLAGAGDDLNKLIAIENGLIEAINNPQPDIVHATPSSPPPTAPASASAAPAVPAAAALGPTTGVPASGAETPSAQTTAAAPVAPAASEAVPSPSSPEAIEARIFALAKGTEFESKAKDYVAGAKKDLTGLLQIEEALKERLGSTAQQTLTATPAVTASPGAN
jgi:AAA domain